MPLIILALTWVWWISTFSYLSFFSFVLAAVYLNWKALCAMARSLKGKEATSNRELAEQIVLIFERAEQREQRWTVSLRNEFSSEDPQ